MKVCFEHFAGDRAEAQAATSSGSLPNVHFFHLARKPHVMLSSVEDSRTNLMRE